MPGVFAFIVAPSPVPKFTCTKYMQYVDSRFTETKLHNASPCYKKTALARGGGAGEGTQLPQNLLARHFLNSVIFFIVFYQIDWLCASVNKFQLPSVSYTHTFGKIFANTLHRFPRICSGDLLMLALFLWLLFAVQRITKLGHSHCLRLRVCLHYYIHDTRCCMVVFVTDSVSFCISYTVQNL